LFSAAFSSLGRFLWALFKLGVNAFKETLIHLHRSTQNILFIPGRHRHPDFVHHIPYWFNTFSAKYALNLQGRIALFCGSHEMNRPKPIWKRKVGRLHHCTASQGRAGSILFTLKLTYALHPIIVGSFTFPAANSQLLKMFPEIVPLRLFVGKHGVEIYKLHNNHFGTKLLGRNVAY
jgi:hypothetical protein